MSHPSSSHVQQSIEKVVLAKLAERLGDLSGDRRIHLANGWVEVDGASTDGLVLVEVYVHVGKLKGAQPHKIARDVLKLITIRAARPDARLVLAFCDDEAADVVQGKGWLAHAVTVWNVEHWVVAISDAERAAVIAARDLQRMTNATVESADAEMELT